MQALFELFSLNLPSAPPEAFLAQTTFLFLYCFPEVPLWSWCFSCLTLLSTSLPGHYFSLSLLGFLHNPNISCPIRHVLFICLWDQSRLENLQYNYLKWSHATRIRPSSLRTFTFCLLPSTWGSYILIARSQVRTAAPISHSVIFRLSAHLMWWTWRGRTQPWNVGRNLLDFCTGIWTEGGEGHQNDSVRPYGSTEYRCI